LRIGHWSTPDSFGSAVDLPTKFTLADKRHAVWMRAIISTHGALSSMTACL